MDAFSYLLSFVEGILTFVSPCILPLLPVYLVYLAGISGENSNFTKENKRRLLINSTGFVLGFTLVFVLLGATATSIGSFLKSNIGVFRKVGGIIMVVFGLGFIGVLKLNFLNFEKKLDYKFKELKFMNSCVFGMVFAFGWTPCVGYLLSSALLMAGNSDTILQGILLLLAYSLGLGLPFLLSAVIYENVRASFRKLQRHNRTISIISGIVLIIAGILSFTDNLKYLSLLSW